MLSTNSLYELLRRTGMGIITLATGIHIHEEIIVEILNRLPVRPLLRFKCVCKNWDALISDPYFKMKHRSSPNSKLLIYQRSTTQDGMLKFKFYSLSLLTSEDVQELDSPLTYYVNHYELFASFDGLVLLKADTQLLLWNPLYSPIQTLMKSILLVDWDMMLLVMAIRSLS
ncbi:hypothetical protein BC332_17825 [Capsicum chinense]|nr:hypothetical protein BC332_17825 [Capsicum chinense]